MVKDHPTFRERSETPEVSRDISLQPLDRCKSKVISKHNIEDVLWLFHKRKKSKCAVTKTPFYHISYFIDGVDGVILFSDILTPLPAMGVDFDVSEGGKIRIDPVRTREELAKRLQSVSKTDFEEKCCFVGSVLKELRKRLARSDTTLLGFVGLPFTLASYLVEGKTGVADGFPNVSELIKGDPETLHSMLGLLADNIINYACYQIDSGAQVVQVFDSWAGHVCDEDYELFCEPYQRRVIQGIKQQYPDTPIIIYMAPGPYSAGGRRLNILAGTGVDIVSIDHTIDIELGLNLLADHKDIGIQGNLDPEILRDGPIETIRSQTLVILEKLKGRRRCILNLGHGILPDTPEVHAQCFIKTVQGFEI